jgi:hypothetical protein
MALRQSPSAKVVEFLCAEVEEVKEDMMQLVVASAPFALFHQDATKNCLISHF